MKSSAAWRFGRTVFAVCLAVMMGIVCAGVHGMARAEENVINITQDAIVLTWEDGKTYRVTGTVTTTGRFTVSGNVVLQLDEGATLSCGGINVFSEKRLTIQGSGTLIANASSVNNAAGIGGSYDGGGRGAGEIIINGGTITATGGQYGAGIGGGLYGNGGHITINGGTVTATGGTRAAGIGGGGNMNWAGKYGNVSEIIINGGTITATGGAGGAGIGSGGGNPSTSSTVEGGTAEVIMIRGGQVTATGTSGGAGIGPGVRGQTLAMTLDWTNTGDYINAATITAEAYTLAEDLYYTADGNDYGAVTAENLPGKDAGYIIRPRVYPFQGAGTQGSPYKIGSAEDWDALCNLVSRGKGNYDSAYYKMTGDISVTTMLGTSARPFRGTFDGMGHTLNVNLSGSGQCVAPFSYINGATIKDLKVTGTVSGGMHCSGLAGGVSGGSSIADVEISAAITTSGTHCGGIIGHGGGYSTTLENCVFSGSITGGTTVGTIWGWSDSSAVATIRNCMDMSSSIYPIGQGAGTANVTNTYYTLEDKGTGVNSTWSGANLGRHAWTVDSEPALTAVLTGTTGQYRNGKIYAAEGERIVFTAAQNGTEMTELWFEGPSGDYDVLQAQNGLFTAVMPEGNAHLMIPVDPRELAVTGGTEGVNYTYKNGVVTINDAGTYTISMAEGIATTAHRIVIDGAATVTLNGVTIETADEGVPLSAKGGSTIKLAGENSLATTGTTSGIIATSGTVTITSAAGNGSTQGTLDVTCEEDCALGGSFTIRGGTVTAEGLYGAAAGLTVTGGKVAVGSYDDEQALQDGSVTIAFPEGKSVMYTSYYNGRWEEREDAPYTGSVTLTGVEDEWVRIQTWQAPQVTISAAAAEHLVSIRDAYRLTVLYPADGTQSLAEFLGAIQPGTYRFTFDYPVMLTTGGDPEARAGGGEGGLNNFGIDVTIPSGGTAAFDPRSDAFYVTYVDTDGTELYRQGRYPGYSMYLYQQPDEQGKRFQGWKKSNGEVIPAGYTYVTLNEAATLTAEWEMVSWHSITATAGLRALKAYNPAETRDWANTGDTVNVYARLVETPKGKYCTGLTVNGTTTINGISGSFVMPDEDVTLTPVYADGTDIVFDLTGTDPVTVSGFQTGMLTSNAYDWGIIMAQGPVEGESQKYWYRYDMNGDGAADAYVLFNYDAGSVMMRRLAGANALTRNYRMCCPGFQEVHEIKFIRTFDTEFTGEGTQSSPWLIQSTDDWVTLGVLIEAGTDTTGKYFQMTDNFQIETPVGSADHPFKGNFNGSGHTLNMTLEGGYGEESMAPFRAIDCATIRNLTTAGTVKGADYSAGLVARASGTNEIDGCVVQATIHCAGSGSRGGGIVGNGTTSTTTMVSCVFSGSITNVSAAGTLWGWSDEGSTITMTDCIDVSSSWLPIGVGGGTPYLTNVYYTSGKYIYITGEWPRAGKMAYGLTAGEGITLTDGSGILYNGTYYMPGGETMSVSAKRADGTALSKMQLEGTGVLMVLTGQNGLFTYTSPSTDLTATEYIWTPGLSVTGGTGYTYADGVLTITDTGNYTVSMAEGVDKTFDTIVTTGAATVTLNGVTIETSDGTAMTAAEGTTIKLAGINILTSGGQDCYGIATSGSGITITSAAGDGSTDGTLTVKAGNSQAALGSNTTIRGGSITASGMAGIRTGLTVTGGKVRLCSNDSEAIIDGQVHLNYPQGRQVCVFMSNNDYSWTMPEGSPCTGVATVTNLTKRYILIKEYETPVVTVTADGRTHLVEIYKDDGTEDPLKIYTRGTDDLDAVLGSMEDGRYAFMSDWPLKIIKQGEPYAECLQEKSKDGLYAYTYQIWPGSGLSIDKDRQWVCVTYTDTDGVTVLKEELVNSGRGTKLWQPVSDVPGQTFDGWLAPDGTRYAPGDNVIIQEAMMLKISWTEKEWHYIYSLNGMQVTTRPPELRAVTWANTGDLLSFSAENVIIPKGKYYTGATINGEALSFPMFRMPAYNITIAAVFADQQIRVIDLSDGMESISGEDYDKLAGVLEELENICCGSDTYEDGSYEEFWDVNGDYDPDFTFRWDADDEFTGVYRASGADVLRRNYTLTHAWSDTAFLFRFGNYMNAADLVLPAALTRIEESAFEGDTSFSVVEIPGNCTNIGKWAFKDCTGLKQIWIPEGCAVGTDAFEGCISVEIFGVAGSPAEDYCDTHDNCTFVGQ